MGHRVIEAEDRTWHAPWCDFVRALFPGADFSRWIAWGEWDDAYRAFALVEGERVLASASVARMRLLVDGEPTAGFQLGAVGCLPSHRGRGLARAVLDAALGSCGEAPVLLFANPRARAFYPRFGLAPRDEHLFVADRAFAPAGEPAATLDPSDPEVRARLRELAADGVPMTRRFGAVGFGRIASWYAASGLARPLRRLDDDLWVVAGVEGDTLFLDGVFARAHRDLATLVPRLVDRPVSRVRLGFGPDCWWPDARAVGVDPERDLFVRGFPRLPPTPHRFPLLAQT